MGLIMMKTTAFALAAIAMGATGFPVHAAIFLSAPNGMCAGATGCFGDASTYRQTFSASGLTGPLDIRTLGLDRSVLGALQDKVVKISFKTASGVTVSDWGGYVIAGLSGDTVSLIGRDFTWTPDQGDLVLQLDLVSPHGSGSFGGGGGLNFGGGLNLGADPVSGGVTGIVDDGTNGPGAGAAAGGPPSITDPPSIASIAPEPAAWAMMLLGLGAAGGALRRTRRLAT